MGLKQVSFVERSSLSQRVPCRRFHCSTTLVNNFNVGYDYVSSIIAGSIKLLKDENKQWELQVDHSIFSLHCVDITVSKKDAFSFPKISCMQFSKDTSLLSSVPLVVAV